MRFEPRRSYERDSLTAEESDAIAEWLANNKPRQCPPRTYALDANDQIGWRDQAKRAFSAKKQGKANILKAAATRTDRAEKRRAQVAILSRQGVKIQDIADRLGVSYDVIRKDKWRLRRRGEDIDPPRRETKTEKVLRVCREHTVPELAKMFGLSQSGIRNILSRHQVGAKPATGGDK